ncbi:Acetyl-CoA carboxylase, biotin carboxylase [Peptoniphilus sp. ING2-D1G]|nr:Acetyl-CoA carboxylase, biotin carboxylase [Peptoniphilus sp. ING2-D1G]
MLKKILIANRGEIALSISRNCRELGIETVVVYSEADKDQPAVFFSDESYCLGPARSGDSYLNKDALITIALKTGCDAIHPGYGFLSENADFAEQVEKSGLVFIGPDSDVIKLMGDKIEAKKLVDLHGIPTVPGKNEVIKSEQHLMKSAIELGYPVLLKASGGGGGKGMRRVNSEKELVEAWNVTKREAAVSFLNDSIYVEKFIENPRHVEVQILADNFGNVVHLYERDCSIQRNNQKIIEESPCDFVEKELLEKMYKAAIDCAKACNYTGVGTVEFIVKDGKFYFMEMNTRLQVEYAVTEMITGINIIKEQIRIASGLKLSFDQSQIKKEGHAIEFRINAQNPINGFSPDCGKVNFYFTPGGKDTRVETFLYTGIEISPFYDSMLGKILVFDKTRLKAIKKMRRAIEETVIDGINTNLGFGYAIFHEKDFIRGNINTNYIRNQEEQLVEQMKAVEAKRDQWEV